MPGQVKLEVTEGPMKGKLFLFEEHDAFLFGRMPECHAQLPQDPMVSRHQFILEANPPDACIRDLGSLNGTFINGIRHGGRMEVQAPKDVDQYQYPGVVLEDGDQIRVGETVLQVHLVSESVCYQCHKPIADEQRAECASIGGTFLCVICREKLAGPHQKALAPESLCCQVCGKEVADEVGQGRHGNYICEECRQKAGLDAGGMVEALFREELDLDGNRQKTPKISGYEIISCLGIGGFGAVYLARRKSDTEFVAIKVMLSHVAVDDAARIRFMREIEVTKGMRHKNIVSLLSSGSSGGAFYFIMEYCQGGSLDALLKIRGGRMELSEARPLMKAVLEGLVYVHTNNVVHRDINPRNILLTGPESNMCAKIADLGLAKNFQLAGLSGLTMTGQQGGTPDFMPREQVTNFKDVKPVGDIWSTGATFYNMLTGRSPRNFPKGRDAMEVVLSAGVVPIRKRNPTIPRAVAEVIDRAIADRVADRYQTAVEMRDALEDAL